MQRAAMHIRARAFWSALTAVITAGALAQPACARSDAQQVQDPASALRSGEYDAAIRGLQSRLASSPGDLRTRRLLFDALYEVARYDDAIAVAEGAPSEQALAFANPLGEALMARGRLEDAQSAFQRALDGGARDASVARLNLAILQERSGDIDGAFTVFDGFIDFYNNSTTLSAEDLTAVGTAVRHLGPLDPELFKDAVKAYDEAITEADAVMPESARPTVAFTPRLLMAELFLEKYSSTDAQDLLAEVLSMNPNHPRALLGLAEAKYFDGSTEPLELVSHALDIAPDYVEAHIFSARLQADLENFAAARAEIGEALAINPTSLEALAVRAGIEFVTGEQQAYEATRQRTLGINPAYAEFYNVVADMAVRNRHYDEAVDLARAAVALDARSWRGFGILGLNLLRAGQVAEARSTLETAFAGDPYNVWIKNTLDLLDTFDQYRTETSERFAFMLHGDEAQLLAPYFSALAEEAYTELSARYRYSPPTPIRVEVYPSHADFSVRTVGLGGLGALGVAFGTNLAMDSPSARDRGDFNWGSTLWHEITHTFTLGLTDHRVPRWFTEGLSVLEERRARRGWGDDVNVEFLGAYRRDALLPIATLNMGFVRPTYPQQVGVSYFQASLICELIERDWGFDSILDMLAAYRTGASDTEVFENVLDVRPSEFDRRFQDYVEERFGRQAGAIQLAEQRGEGMLRSLIDNSGGAFVEALRRGAERLEEDDLEGAKEAFARAKELFPEYAGNDSPYQFLARVYLEEADTAAAAAELEQMTAINENAYDANLALASLQEGLGNDAAAAAALERVIYVFPYEISLHERLADLYTTTGELDNVVRERRAVVALEPVDRADALYRLALAYFEAGDRASARTTVLRSLEIAPNYEAAQELLLRIAG